MVRFHTTKAAIPALAALSCKVGLFGTLAGSSTCCATNEPEIPFASGPRVLRFD
jgi:hypothetical protein